MTDHQAWIRRLRPDEAAPLAAFYDALSEASQRLFRPLGFDPGPTRYQEVAGGNAPHVDQRLDLVAVDRDGAVIGWAFVQGLQGDRPSVGLGVADAWQGRGLGRMLMTRLFEALEPYALDEVYLTVVKDNAIARHLYESFGFATYDEMTGDQDGLTYLCMSRER